MPGESLAPTRRLVSRAREELDDRSSVVAARFRVRDERDSVRPERAARCRERREDSAYDLRLAEHRGGKEVEPRPALEQEQGNVPCAHVGGCAESGLPVAASPVPRGVHELRLAVEERADAIEVRVGDGHELLYKCIGEAWRPVVHAASLEEPSPNFLGPPLHHHDFDDPFYVLEGELTFQVERDLVTYDASVWAERRIVLPSGSSTIAKRSSSVTS